MMSSKALGLLRLTRPLNGFMMGLGVVVGSVVAAGINNLPWDRVFIGALVGFMLNSASMILNDYVDREIDAINNPTRPLVTGVVTVGEALTAFTIFTALGVVFSALLGPLPLAIALIAAADAYAYNIWGKRTGLPGNIMVAFTTAVPFIFGGAVARPENWLSVSILAILAFLSNVAREIVKGVADIVGDSLKGVRTVAVRWGAETASLIAALIMILAVALSPLPYLKGQLGPLYMALVIPADAIFTYYSILMVRDPSPKRAVKVKKMYLYGMLIALIAFIAGRLTPPS